MNIKPQQFLNVKSIATRPEVNYLESEIKKLLLTTNDKLVVLDFSETTHISRSAADELLNAKDRTKSNGIQLIFSNLNDFNKKMLDLVESKKVNPPIRKTTFQNIPVIDL